jgi:hypothetical protein
MACAAAVEMYATDEFVGKQRQFIAAPSFHGDRVL